MTPTEQTNSWVRVAIMAVRIDRNPATMGALYDALNRRRNARAYQMPEWMHAAWRFETDSDLRTWGRVERTHRELAAAVERHRPHGSQ